MVQNREYTIQKGDSLWSIALAHLGDGSRWPELWELNRAAIEAEQVKQQAAVADRKRRGCGPGLIYPGAKLRIPAAAT